jgi:hypothetical protein
MDPDGDALFGLDEPWRKDHPKPRVDRETQDEILIFGDYRPPRSEMDLLLDELMSGLMASTHPVVGPAIVESNRRLPRVGELLRMKPRQQHGAVRRPPYRDLVLANCLLDESNKVADQRPGEAYECALLAERIADQPWPDEPEKAAYIRINALIRQAETFRLKRDWKKAELRFAAAYTLLQGRGDHYARSSFCLHLSELRTDQGRYPEAEVLLMYSMRTHCLRWNTNQPPSGDLYRLAVLALKQNDPGRAMAITSQLYLDHESNPLSAEIPYEADIIRAICMAAIGHAEAARSLMADARSKWRRIPDRGKTLPLEWLDSRISAHLGDLDQAIPRLEAIRRWVNRTLKLDEICLASIDLALAHAKKGQAAPRLRHLLADLAKNQGAVEKPWVLGSLWRFREELGRGKDPAAAAREAAEIVHRREMSLKGLAARRHPARKKGLADRPQL